MTLLLTACTGGAVVSGAGSAGVSGQAQPGSGTASAGGSAPSDNPTTSADERITRFTKLWSWQPLGHVADITLHRIAGIATTPDRVVIAAERRKTFIGLIGTRTTVMAADPDTRRVVWSRQVRGDVEQLRAVGSAIVLETQAVVRSKAVGTLIGFDAEDGHELWRKDGVPEFAVVGTSVYADTLTGGKAGVRFDARTGKVQASMRGGIDRILAASADRVVTGGSVTIQAFDSDLKRTVWQVQLPPNGGVDSGYIVGDTFVAIFPQVKRQVRILGYDLATGHRLWSHTLTLDGSLHDGTAVVFGDNIALRTDRSVTAFAAKDGVVAWHVGQSAARYFAASTTTTSNMLGCDRSLVSVSSDGGGLYGYVDLPRDIFAAQGCVAPPVPLPSNASDPDGVVLTGPTDVVAYRTTTSSQPRTKADGFGRWGPLAPNVCKAPDTTQTDAALTRAIGPRWYLNFAHPNSCEWQPPDAFPVAQTGNLSSARAAKTYLEPGNRLGGCRIASAVGGRERSLPITGLGLPKGSGACLLTGYRVGQQVQADVITGVGRTRGGQWFYVEFFYPHNEAINFSGPTKLLVALRTLGS